MFLYLYFNICFKYVTLDHKTSLKSLEYILYQKYICQNYTFFFYAKNC